MRRTLQVSVLCLAAGVVSACSNPEQVIQDPVPPTGAVRFINAVPDTGAMDLRFVDIVENNAHYNVSFRDTPSTSGGVTISTQLEYHPTKAGSRHFRIFLYGTTAAVASTVLVDTTVSIVEGHLYTAMMWGNAKSGANAPDHMRLTFIDEGVPDPGSGNVGLRVINTTGSSVDVRQYLSSGTVPTSATWSVAGSYDPNVALTKYVNVPAGQYKFNVRAAGASSTLFTDALALVGADPTCSSGVTCTSANYDTEALPGTTQAGSDVTAIIWPKSVSGTAAASFSTPGISFVWDRRPPRPNGI